MAADLIRKGDEKHLLSVSEKTKARRTPSTKDFPKRLEK
jgi:hypothetical protein